MPREPRHNPEPEIAKFKAAARTVADAMKNLLEAWYDVESSGANVPLSEYSAQQDLIAEPKKYEFPFHESLEDMVHSVYNWVGEIDGAPLKDWNVAKEILYQPKPLTSAEKRAALIAAAEFKRRVGARIIKEAQEAVAEYERKVGISLTNDGMGDNCYKCGQPIEAGQMELYGEGGAPMHQDCQAAAREAQQRAQQPQQTPGQKIQQMPQRGYPKSEKQLGLQRKPQEVGYAPDSVISSKQAAPTPGVPDDEHVDPEQVNDVQEFTEQNQPKQEEVHRDAPATEPTPEMESPSIEAPESFEEPGEEAAPAAVEAPASFEEPAAEGEDVHEEDEEPVGSPEVAARAEVEGILTNPELIEAVMEFLKAEEALDSFTVEDEGMHGVEVAKIEIGNMEFYVVADDSAAESIAVEMVKEDLSSQPEIFNQDWLQGYIDEDRLRDQLQNDVENEIRENPDSYGWESGTRIEEEEEYEEGVAEMEQDDQSIDRDLLVPPDEVEEDEPSDEWVEDKAKEILRDPIEYLTEIYGREDGLKQAMSMAGIDEDKAAQDAVDTDGAGHFLSSYDGETHDLPNGGVYWRHN